MELKTTKWNKSLEELYNQFKDKVSNDICVYNHDNPYLEFADELIETNGKDIVEYYALYKNHLVVEFA